MPSIVDFSGAEMESPAGRGKLRLSPAEIARFRAALMLAMDRRGWSLRQLGAIFGVSAGTVSNDLKAIPPEAEARLSKLAGSLSDSLPTPEQMEAFLRGLVRRRQKNEGRKKNKRRGRWGDVSASAAPQVPYRSNPSPEARRLAAQAAIDARCLEVLAGCRGRIGTAAKALGITAARVRAAIVRKPAG